MKKGIGIGIDSFKEIRKKETYYIDKTALVKEIIDNDGKIILFTRPRRFGKTLNMDMLKDYFAISEEDNYYLFKDLYIDKEGSYKEYFGKYPVISLTFKGVSGLSYEEASYYIKKEISKEYERHSYLLDSEVLKEYEKKKYKSIIMCEGELFTYGSSIYDLCKYLYMYHKEKAIILMDEYDTPLHYAKLQDYYKDMVMFMRTLMVNAMKGNEYLYKAVLTGITRIAQESIFSAFNNPYVSTVLDYYCSDKFGFTDEEIREMLRYYELEDKYEEVKSWYNGYYFGDDIIYNPWSILSYVRDIKNEFKVYWVNTGNIDLIKKSIRLDEAKNKKIVEKLLKKEYVEVNIDTNIVYDTIFDDSDNCWSLLLQSGYLKAKRTEELNVYYIEIPNKEIRYIYKDIIINWFKLDMRIGSVAKNAIESLLEQDFDSFEMYINEILIKNISYYDISFNKNDKLNLPSTQIIKENTKYENFYHGVILGMLVYLERDYIIESNKEYGLGRADIVIIPRDKQKEGFILEFKRAKKDDKKTLDNLADEALEQIKNNKYEEGLQQYSDKAFIKLGIGYKGKECKVKKA